ncbi:hypothetical protein ACLB2K_063568 [Fragaria x ananassa]
MSDEHIDRVKRLRSKDISTWFSRKSAQPSSCASSQASVSTPIAVAATEEPSSESPLVGSPSVSTPIAVAATVKFTQVTFSSWLRHCSQASPDHHVIEMTSFDATSDLKKFFEDVDLIQTELNDLQKLNSSLKRAHEQSKSLHKAKEVKDLRTRMDADVNLALKAVKLLKVRLETLDRSNASAKSLPGCGPGSSSDRTRTSVVSGLRKKLKDSMESFNDLRQKISSEYKETVQRRYFTVTG